MSTNSIEYRETEKQNTEKIKEEALSNDRIRLYMFNVGQGDHFLLRFPDGSYGILDFFFDGRLNQAESPGLSYLKALIRHKLEEKPIIKFIYVSHPDLDHISGLNQTLKWIIRNNIRVDNLWSFSENYTLDSISDILSKVKEDKSVKLENKKKVLKAGSKYEDELKALKELIARIEKVDKRYIPFTDEKTLAKDDNIPFKAQSLGPLTKQVRKHLKTLRSLVVETMKELIEEQNIDASFLNNLENNKVDKNILSGILSLKIGNYKLLFAGDMDAEPLEECINKAFDIEDFKAHFVKGIHHGSHNSSSRNIWKKILVHDGQIIPHIGISAGYHKKYKHPRKETLSDIRAVTQDRNAETHVNSTNNFKEYPLETYSINKNIDWIWLDSAGPDDVTATLKTNELGKTPSSGIGEVIAAYVYDFYLDKNEIELQVATTSLLIDSREIPTEAELRDQYSDWAIPFEPIIK